MECAHLSARPCHNMTALQPSRRRHVRVLVSMSGDSAEVSSQESEPEEVWMSPEEENAAQDRCLNIVNDVMERLQAEDCDCPQEFLYPSTDGNRQQWPQLTAMVREAIAAIVPSDELANVVIMAASQKCMVQCLLLPQIPFQTDHWYSEALLLRILEEVIDQLSGTTGQFEVQARQLQQQIWGHLGSLIQCSSRQGRLDLMDRWIQAQPTAEMSLAALLDISSRACAILAIRVPDDRIALARATLAVLEVATAQLRHVSSVMPAATRSMVLRQGKVAHLRGHLTHVNPQQVDLAFVQALALVDSEERRRQLLMQAFYPDSEAVSGPASEGVRKSLEPVQPHRVVALLASDWSEESLEWAAENRPDIKWEILDEKVRSQKDELLNEALQVLSEISSYEAPSYVHSNEVGEWIAIDLDESEEHPTFANGKEGYEAAHDLLSRVTDLILKQLDLAEESIAFAPDWKEGRELIRSAIGRMEEATITDPSLELLLEECVREGTHLATPDLMRRNLAMGNDWEDWITALMMAIKEEMDGVRRARRGHMSEVQCWAELKSLPTKTGRAKLLNEQVAAVKAKARGMASLTTVAQYLANVTEVAAIDLLRMGREESPNWPRQARACLALFNLLHASARVAYDAEQAASKKKVKPARLSRQPGLDLLQSAVEGVDIQVTQAAAECEDPDQRRTGMRMTFQQDWTGPDRDLVMDALRHIRTSRPQRVIALLMATLKEGTLYPLGMKQPRSIEFSEKLVELRQQLVIDMMAVLEDISSELE